MAEVQEVEEQVSVNPGVSSKVKHSLRSNMLIGQLATATGISRDTLRFYEQQGLIRARRRENGYRDYPDEAVLLLTYIRTAQGLGFTLTEIGHKLPSIWHADDPGPAILQVLGDKLQEIDVRIDALRRLRKQLSARLALDCPLTSDEGQTSPP